MNAISPEDYPSEIRLNAGVLHSPPFTYIEEEPASENTMAMFPGSDTATGKTTFRGFTIDLLERLKVFASVDNVDLQVDLRPAPDFYDDAFTLVASDCETTIQRGTSQACHKYDLLVGELVNS